MIDKSFKKLIENSSKYSSFYWSGYLNRGQVYQILRSPTGIWKKYQPIEFKDFLSSETIRIEAWKENLKLIKISQKQNQILVIWLLPSLLKDGKVKM